MNWVIEEKVRYQENNLEYWNSDFFFFKKKKMQYGINPFF